MNYYLISAGIFLFLALLVHMIAGDREYRKIKPSEECEKKNDLFGFWLMGRGTFQMVSVDLLLTSGFVFLTGVGFIPYNYSLMLFILLLYAGYMIFWLITLAVSKATSYYYVRNGQWILFLITGVLISFGIFR